MHIKPHHEQIIRDILSKYPYTFYVFGSRAKGNPKEFSDLDLCLMEPVDGHILSQIDGEFEESDLPYTVDVINWPRCTKDFQGLIRPGFILFQSCKGEMLPIH